MLGVDGISDFDGLHSRKHNDEVQFYAFDMLATESDDIWKLPLTMRKSSWRGASGAMVEVATRFGISERSCLVLMTDGKFFPCRLAWENGHELE